MKLFTNTKTRIEFSNITAARRYKKQGVGGWLAITDNKVYWYSNPYTPTQVFEDLPGNVKLEM